MLLVYSTGVYNCIAQCIIHYYTVCMARKTKFKALQVHENTHTRVTTKAKKKKLTVDEFINKLL